MIKKRMIGYIVLSYILFSHIKADNTVTPISEEDIFQYSVLSANFAIMLQYINQEEELPDFNTMLVTELVREGLSGLVNARVTPSGFEDLPYVFSIANMGWIYSFYYNSFSIANLSYNSMCYIVAVTVKALVGQLGKSSVDHFVTPKKPDRFFTRFWGFFRRLTASHSATSPVTPSSPSFHPQLMYSALAYYICNSWPALAVIMAILSTKVMADIIVDNNLAFSYYLRESTDPHYNFRNDFPVYVASMFYSFTSKSAEEFYKGYLDESMFSEIFINLLRLHVTLNDNLEGISGDTVKMAKELYQSNTPEFIYSDFPPDSATVSISKKLQGVFENKSRCAQFRFSRTGDVSEVSEVFYYDACRGELSSEDSVNIIFIFPTTNSRSSYLAGKFAHLSDMVVVAANILGSDWVTVMLWPLDEKK